MPTKTPVDKAEELLKPTLEAAYDPQSLIALAPIHTDQTIADIGCGPGWLSVPLGKYLYGGKLYAIDVQEGMLDILKARLDTFKMKNVEVVLSKESSIPLDDEIVDGAVMSGSLNEAARPKSLFKEAFRLMRKSAWLAVVEWLPPSSEEPPFGPPAKQRIPMEELIGMGEELGLTKARSRQIGQSHYVVIFKK
jgi:ubiquinone/menaquinone biosynthesis C-methylase UbiE